MIRRPWDDFFEHAIRRMCSDHTTLLDIGGGLRIDPKRSNRIDREHTWISALLTECGITYTIMDYVDTFHPDVVGDIQNMPFPDSSQEAIVCLAILEHVEDPFMAVREIRRVLRPGGSCLVYVPFLYYYHAERGYYADYWRFTEDGVRALFREFSDIEIAAVRGPLETFVRLSPLGRFRISCDIAFLFDRLFGKLTSKQVSGYYAYVRTT